MNVLDVLKGVFKSSPTGGSVVYNMLDKYGPDKIMSGVSGKYLGTNMTPAEVESFEKNAAEAQKQRDWSEHMSNTTYQRTVQDMRDAGLNPSVMLAGGAGTVSTPSGSTASAPAPSSSDLLSAIMLPLQMKVLRAQARNIDADSDLKAEQAETQRSVQRLNSLTADWMPEMNKGQLSKWFAEVKQALSASDLNVAQADKVTSEADAQKILNKYLDERQRAELDNIKAEKGHIDAQKRLALAEAWFKEIQANYANENKVLMSNSDTLAIVLYIGHSIWKFITKISKSLRKFGNKFLYVRS